VDFSGEAMTCESKNRNDSSDVVLEAAFEALRPDDNGEGIVQPLNDVALQRRCRETVAQHHRRSAQISARYRVPKWTAVTIGLSLLGVGLALYLHASRADENRGVEMAAPDPMPENLHDSVIPGSRIALLKGTVFLGDRAAKMGMPVSGAGRIETKSGQAALTLPAGIGIGLSENTSARVIWNGGRQYGVTVYRGMAIFSVDPLQSKARERFFVMTPAGTVYVRGTLFTVVVTAKKEVFVQLHRGELMAETTGGISELLTSGPLTSFGGEEASAADDSMAQRVSEQLQALSCMDVADIFSELSHVECLVQSLPEPKMAKEENAVSSDKKGAPFGRQLTIKELMDLARSRKSRRNWRGAADAYQTLIRYYPRSNEARTSLVSLAELQLNHLEEPRAALRLFSKYLKKPGPLAREALYGKAESYRALGNSQEEARILVDFLVTFPDGVYAKSARKRLKALRANQVPH
jgi:TolA-binding protein